MIQNRSPASGISLEEERRSRLGLTALLPSRRRGHRSVTRCTSLPRSFAPAGAESFAVATASRRPTVNDDSNQQRDAAG